MALVIATTPRAVADHHQAPKPRVNATDRHEHFAAMFDAGLIVWDNDVPVVVV